MHFRSATKVGLAVLTSVAVFVAIWFFLIGQGFKSNTYSLSIRFPDAQDITPGAAVRMAGVEVGTVKSIGLAPDNQALIDLRIYKKFKIPRSSRFLVTAGGLIGEKYVSIIPRTGETASIPENTKNLQGQATVQIEDLMAKASQLAGSADQVIQESRLALHETRLAIGQLSRNIQDPRLKASLLASLKNAEIASNNIAGATRTAGIASENIASATRTADQTATDFRSLMTSSKSGVQSTLASVRRSAGNMEDLTGALNGIVSGDDIKTGLGSTMHNIQVASKQLPVITAHMATISANLEKLSGDPTMTADLKETLANLRAASSEARQSSEAINQTLQRVTARFRRPRNPNSGANDKSNSNPVLPLNTLDLVQNTSPGHFHADVNTLFPFGTNSFITAGIYGLGEDNRLNLQIGEASGGNWSTRYGLYKGWLGLGLDKKLGQENGWSMNVYRPNHPSMDLIVRRRLKENTSIVFGVEKVFQNPTPSIGIRIKH